MQLTFQVKDEEAKATQHPSDHRKKFFIEIGKAWFAQKKKAYITEKGVRLISDEALTDEGNLEFGEIYWNAVSKGEARKFSNELLDQFLARFDFITPVESQAVHPAMLRADAAGRGAMVTVRQSPDPSALKVASAYCDAEAKSLAAEGMFTFYEDGIESYREAMWYAISKILTVPRKVFGFSKAVDLPTIKGEKGSEAAIDYIALALDHIQILGPAILSQAATDFELCEKIQLVLTSPPRSRRPMALESLVRLIPQTCDHVSAFLTGTMATKFDFYKDSKNEYKECCFLVKMPLQTTQFRNSITGISRFPRKVTPADVAYFVFPSYSAAINASYEYSQKTRRELEAEGRKQMPTDALCAFFSYSSGPCEIFKLPVSVETFAKKEKAWKEKPENRAKPENHFKEIYAKQYAQRYDHYCGTTQLHQQKWTTEEELAAVKKGAGIKSKLAHEVATSSSLMASPPPVPTVSPVPTPADRSQFSAFINYVELDPKVSHLLSHRS